MLLYYHTQSQNALRCTVFWFLALLALSSMQYSFTAALFLPLTISSVIAFVYFTLLERIENLLLWWLTMIAGAIALLIF
ncbi:hypothetical protein ABT56_15850 [Photobacterium aquae]|uniref:Uncharacterized protein n=2 Tax=Photobacterium aquae TaxID=1195763 RepID=A0A0J1GWU8_9GAMM|nr:hypothetical protein ABT56_15850 [Photobacterium aquae]